IFPVFHDIQVMRMYPGRETHGHEMVVTRDGRLGKVVTGANGHCLRIIRKDGSTPPDGVLLGPPLAPEVKHPDCRPCIALSSDEKSVYASLVAIGGEKIHAVYRCGLDGNAAGKEFIGSRRESGSDDKHLNRPMGMASDKGLLYVADHG